VCVKCRLRRSLVCLQCTMKSETVIGVYKVHSEERHLLVCVQCTGQGETVFGVCKV